MADKDDDFLPLVLRPDCGVVGRHLSLFRMKKAKEGPGAAPALQPERVEQFQLRQEGQDQTQEQDRAPGLFHRMAQTFRNLPGTLCREIIIMLSKAMAKSDTMPTQGLASVPSLDCFGERVVSSPDEVPAFVKNMHESLSSDKPSDDRLFIDILRLTDIYPAEVVLTLLGCAPTCDRFATQTVRVLLRRMQCLNMLMAMERKRGWDTLLNTHTHHYAVGLLAREMRRASRPLCSEVALCLLGLLSWEKPRWEHPAMAFLVEALDCLDMSKCGNSVLQILSRHLRSECLERCRLALRGLVVLSKDPSVAEGMRSLTKSLLELLRDAGGELVAMVLSVFINEVHDRDIRITISTALQMAPALRPLFDHDNIQVRLLSIRLFQKVMELIVDEGKKALKPHVIHSLLPLFFHGHDKNRAVAEASREALLCAATFLRRSDLVKTLKTKEPQRFGECLLAKDRSRSAESLRQALLYLQSPQESLREAALRFIAIAGWHMRGLEEEPQLICEALQAMRKDACPSYTSVVVQAMFDRRAAQLGSSCGSRQPAFPEEHKTPHDRRPPGDQKRPFAAPGTDTGPN
ncbi:hypothetical protein WISP_123182 [Willisornis vidua]|uniref:Maestro/Maestro-like HEAT-repeats domain-containing protein n=1 Tax=Willisornis vidua TaxID=1566151 RepID=A0ABQ9CXS1_9PASS|nr:hypothetical protein WISP_123182 [Willisornis vidua]